MVKIRIQFEASNLVNDDTDIVERFKEFVAACRAEKLEIRRATCEVTPAKGDR